MATNGGWYLITYRWASYSFDDEGNRDGESSEVIFMKPGESIAKHVKRVCKESTHHDDCGYRGMPEGNTCLIKELALLLPDGEKITGFRPHSLKDLFYDSETDNYPGTRGLYG